MMNSPHFTPLLMSFHPSTAIDAAEICRSYQ